jgi:hypothetical protein
MEKEFIPYELALRLKQLGFDISTEYSWVVNKLYPNGIIGHSAPASNRNQYPGHLSAPLYQQCFRWLYQKLDIEKGVMPLDTKSQQLLLKELIDKVSSKHLLV